jgi:hypothetical protein
MGTTTSENKLSVFKCRATMNVDVICSSEASFLPAKIHGVVSQKTTIWIYDFLRNIMWKNKYFLKRGKGDSSVNIRLFTNVFIRKVGVLCKMQCVRKVALHLGYGT